jgi:hypothetical protein
VKLPGVVPRQNLAGEQNHRTPQELNAYKISIWGGNFLYYIVGGIEYTAPSFIKRHVQYLTIPI